MKHILCGTSLFAVAFGLQGQITVDTSDFVHAEESYRMATDTMPGVDIGSSGGPQTWDFTGLEESTGDTVTYFNPSQTAYGDSYSSAAYASKFGGIAGGGAGGPGGGGGGGQNISYIYGIKDGDGVKSMGFAAKVLGSPLVVPAKDPELNYIAPATEGDVATDQALYKGKIGQDPSDPDTTFKRRVTKILEVDAYGTLALPDIGTVEVLRVRDFSVNRDSAIVGGLGGFQIAHDTTVTYRFITNEAGYGEDVAQVEVAPSNEDSVLSVSYIKELDPDPKAFFTVSDTNPSTTQGVDFFNSSGGTSWKWDFGDGSTSTLHQPTHAYDSAGLYTVKLMVSGNGMEDTLVREDKVLVNALSIDDRKALEIGVTLFPNPVDEKLRMELSGVEPGQYQIELIDLMGKTVRSDEMKLEASTERKSFDLGSLSSGTYFYRITGQGGKAKSGRFVVE